MAKKLQPTSVNQTAIGNDNIQVVGSNNVINRITNFFAGDTEAQRALRNRHAMLELVKNTWIKGVLEKSLYNEVLIELGLEERPGAVDHPWDMQVQMPNQTNRALPAGTSMMNVFDQMNGAMLVLGEPGSGKTTMLLELTRDCLKRAQADDNQPIPVIFNLSSWNSKQSIDDWLINELRTKYNVPKKVAQDWVEKDDLHLLLDGLDEVKLENREICINAINKFRQEHGLTMPIAVCSRIVDYEALSTKLNLTGAVFLQPLTPEQIDEYFEQAGSELEGVHQILNIDETLKELVKQPLMLSIMILAYQGKPIDTFVNEKMDTLEHRRTRLFDTYIQQMFERVARTKNEVYSPAQTKHWLSWLAKKMIDRDNIPYVLELMQSNWLSGLEQKYLYQFMVIAGCILIFGPIGWLTGRVINGLFLWIVVGLGLGLGLFFIWLNNISMVDALTWKWQKAKKALIKELLIAIFFSTIGGVVFGLYFMLPLKGLIFGLFCLLAGFFLSMLRAGLSVKQIDNATYSGQRLSYTLKNFLYIFFIITLIIILVSILIGLLFSQMLLYLPNLTLTVMLRVGLTLGTGLGLACSLLYGGDAIIQHYSLHLTLAFYKFLPFRLIPFLDHCVDLIFLRKVGGGYIFVHRLLMEHFAAMRSEETQSLSDVRN